jgi:hypothetical protein
MAQRTWPDGEPRRSEGDPGSVGGVAPDGSARRHTVETEPAPQNFGWLSGVKGVVGGPNRAANGEGVNVGPSSTHWRKAAGPFSTGDQKRRK